MALAKVQYLPMSPSPSLPPSMLQMTKAKTEYQSFPAFSSPRDLQPQTVTGALILTAGEVSKLVNRLKLNHIFTVCVPISLVVPQFPFATLPIDGTHGLMVPHSSQHLSFCALCASFLRILCCMAGICYCTLMVLFVMQLIK